MSTQDLANKEKTVTTPKFKPLGNRILVKRIEAENSLKGGIILPDSAKKKQEQALVLALGTGKTDSEGKAIEFPVKVGDVVLMDKYSGQDVTIEGEEYVIARTDDIIAVVEK